MQTRENRAAAEIRDVLIEYISAFCFYPEHLEVRVLDFPMLLLVSIRAHEADKGRIIGASHARQFRAIREIARGLARRFNIEVEVSEIERSIVGEAEEYAPFKANPDWPREKIEKMLLRLACKLFDSPYEIKVSQQDVSEEKTLMVLHITEPPDQRIMLLQQALSCLFNAIGKKNGRAISVVIMPGTAADDGIQPQRADGRYSSEVRS